MRPMGCLLHLVRLQVYAYQHHHESSLGCRIQLVCLQVYAYWHLPKSSPGCRMRPRGCLLEYKTLIRWIPGTRFRQNWA
jgi:hypothetical protein